MRLDLSLRGQAGRWFSGQAQYTLSRAENNTGGIRSFPQDQYNPNAEWGMIAKIYPGGTVTLEQTRVGDQRWIVNHIVEQLTVRALMVKNVKQRLVFDTSDVQHVDSMSYQQAIRTLLDTPLPAH